LNAKEVYSQQQYRDKKAHYNLMGFYRSGIIKFD